MNFVKNEPFYFQNVTMTKPDTQMNFRSKKKILKKISCTRLSSGVIVLEGIPLRKVHIGQSATYYKCRNMRSPAKLIGVCMFSGRIKHDSDGLEMEILHDHSESCSYLLKTEDKVDNSYTLHSNAHFSLHHKRFKKEVHATKTVPWKMERAIRKKVTFTRLSSGVIVLDGITLQKVRVGKNVTYYRCKNTKTPRKVIGVCMFSGVIRNYLENNVEMEILHDHSPSCSYLLKNQRRLDNNLTLNSNVQFSLIHNRKKEECETVKKKKKRNQFGISESTEQKLNSEDTPVMNIYIQLETF